MVVRLVQKPDVLNKTRAASIFINAFSSDIAYSPKGKMTRRTKEKALGLEISH
jgi:hypothetical protein